MIYFFSILGIVGVAVFIIGQVVFVLDNTFFWKAKVNAIKYDQFKSIEKGELQDEIEELKSENSKLRQEIKEIKNEGSP